MRAGSSRVPGFFALSLDERRRTVAELAGIDLAELTAVAASGGLDDAASDRAREQILAAQAELFALADAAVPRLVARGGGARSLRVRPLDARMLVVDTTLDCRDAMGANLVNGVAEALSDRLAALSGGRAGF